MTTTTNELDTLKVLAKRIAPGQEHLDARFETLGKHQWYGDHGTGKTDNVFVSGPQSAINNLLKTVIPQSSYSPDNWYLWGFDSRSEADRFVHALYPHPVSYWQVGLSRGFAVASEVPLYGFFREPSADHVSAPNQLSSPHEMLLRTERVRACAKTLFSEYGRQVGISAVFVTAPNLDKTPLALSGDKWGQMTLKDEVILWSLFEKLDRARTRFSQALACGVGQGWHFGLNPYF